MASSTFTPLATTFTQTVKPGDTEVIVASTSGIVPGVALYVDREQMMVDRLTGIGNAVIVRRGQNGTQTWTHSTAATVWYGSPDWFFMTDPQSMPHTPPRVHPHINVLTGDVWYVQGDEEGPNAPARTWQKATTTQLIGSLGVRVTTTTIPS